jgi:hypothetical protein
MGIDKIISVSDFAKNRHLENSEFTHFNGSWTELEDKTLNQFESGSFSEGYREGVVLVHMNEMDSKLFYTYNGFPMFEGMKLSAEYKPRREGEEPRICVRILESKIQCKFVDIILYRWDVLEENKERSSNSIWEIVSINGKQSNELEPMAPLTMARNFLHLPGGTKGEFSAEDFANAIVYWSKRNNNG